MHRSLGNQVSDLLQGPQTLYFALHDTGDSTTAAYGHATVVLLSCEHHAGDLGYALTPTWADLASLPLHRKGAAPCCARRSWCIFKMRFTMAGFFCPLACAAHATQAVDKLAVGIVAEEHCGCERGEDAGTPACCLLPGLHNDLCRSAHPITLPQWGIRRKYRFPTAPPVQWASRIARTCS